MYRKSVTETKIHVLNLSLYIHKQNINFKSLNKMQKMIFSAVALVAFSFAGMANENEEKKVEAILAKKESVKATVEVDCDKLANDTMDVYEAAGWSVEEAYEEGLKVYNVCIGKTKKVTQA